MNDQSRKTLSVTEAGKQLGLGKNGAYAAVARGEIPVLRFGSRLRVPVAAFERMLSEAGKEPSTSSVIEEPPKVRPNPGCMPNKGTQLRT
jgi:excisionase family DNA binding protein